MATTTHPKVMQPSAATRRMGDSEKMSSALVPLAT